MVTALPGVYSRDFNERRLLAGAAESLADAELLRVILGCQSRGTSRTNVADNLLKSAGGLRPLLTANADELFSVPGIGPTRIARLRAAVELGRRYVEAPARDGRPLSNPADAACCFKARLGDLPHEVFGCLFLDTRHRIIAFEPLFRGTIDGANVHAREVVKQALFHNAAALIVGHNHPSGSCEPSDADRSITARLRKSLALIDIPLLDHLIVTASEHVSLAERGWL